MPRTIDGQRFRSQVAAMPRALVASATNMRESLPTLSERTRALVKSETWQATCWDMFDTVPEYHYSVTWVGNLMSKAKLNLTYDGVPVADGDEKHRIALGYKDALFGGQAGQTDCLRNIGLQLTVAGDVWIFGSEDAKGNDVWYIGASTEVKEELPPSDDSTGVWRIDEDIQLTDPLAIRLWRPHPRKPSKADAPSRAVLPILRELDVMTQYVGAQMDSRLASAGILFVPNGMTIAGADGASDANGLVKEMLKVAKKAMIDRSDASTVIPLVVEADGEFIDKVKHVTFWSELQEALPKMREEAIRRLSLGMDMPPEVLTGTGDMNHWNSWQTEEAAIKAHAEPMLEVITSSLTTGYLWPLLRTDDEQVFGEEELQRYGIGADTTALRLRPNRSKEAIELYDRGELSAEAMLRENGFDVKGDRMDEKELANWLLRRAATGSTTPNQVAAAMRALGAVQIPLDDAQPREERPKPSLEEHPEREVPDVAGDPLVAASLVYVWRALERVGNRLRNKHKLGIPNVEAADTYRYAQFDNARIPDLIDGSWDRLGDFSSAWGVDQREWTAALDAYTRVLIIEKQPIDLASLARAVSLVPRKEQPSSRKAA